MVRKKNTRQISTLQKGPLSQGFFVVLQKYLKNRIALAVFICVIGLILLLFLIVSFSGKGKNINQTRKESIKTEQDILGKVAELIILPPEQPQIATVSDISKLKGQVFFKHAVNGDKLLIYTQSGRAILYRPSQNILVEVANLNTAQENKIVSTPVSPTPAQNTTTPLRIRILNGTAQSGAAAQVQEDLEELYPDNIYTTEDAIKNYTQTTIYNSNNLYADLVTQLASRFGWSIGSGAPQNEKATESDILILVGEQR